MKPKLLLLLSAFVAVFFAACGDESTTEKNSQAAHEVTVEVDSIGDLPKCGDDNDGERIFVNEDESLRICASGKWFAMAGSEGARSDSDFSCTTKELKDKSGIKIICNGDSIGVVLNGTDGKDGKKGDTGKNGTAGVSCNVVDKTDTSVTLACGDSTLTFDLGYRLGESFVDSLVLDSEKVAVSMDSLTGFSQKGPFLKGATVYLYELSDGRTLKQTNGNFTSNIMSDNGRYKFNARNLVSQYAMVVVDGHYRNEVTGENSKTAIKLKALTDVIARKSANVNLLTHLEFERVYYLVTKQKKRVKAAKREAQAEILKLFHVDTTGLKGFNNAEDLDVFGSSDADAVLLAVSILLQGDRSEAEMMALLSEISNAMVEKGEWNDSAAKVKIADWALAAECADKLPDFRRHVAGWGLSDTVPEFEKFLRRYVSEESGLGICGDSSVPVNTPQYITKSKSGYYAKSYADIGTSNIRFICKTEGGARWHVATDLEKDTLGWTRDTADGAVRRGQIDTNLTYVFNKNAGAWRHGTDFDWNVGVGCIPDRKGKEMQGSDGYWYKCADSNMIVEESQWTTAWRLMKKIERDTVGWSGQSFKEGAVRNGKENKKQTYVYEKNTWRYGTDLDSIVGFGCIEAFVDSMVTVSGKLYKCNGDTILTYEYFSWSSAWRLATPTEIDLHFWKLNKNTKGTLLTGPGTGTVKVWDSDTLRLATEKEKSFGKGCVKSIDGKRDTLGVLHSFYTCKNHVWTFDSVNVITDPRDSTVYPTIKIGSQIWMKENLIFKYKVNGKDYGFSSYCDGPSAFPYCTLRAQYGLYYTWAAAMDSAGVFGSDGEGCGLKTACGWHRNEVRGICPEGWHLPSKGEFETLVNFVGEKNYTSSTAGARLKAVNAWRESFESGGWYRCYDSFGFSAYPYPGNTHQHSGTGDYYEYVYYVSSTEEMQSDGTNKIYRLELRNASNGAEIKPYEGGGNIRCIMDED